MSTAPTTTAPRRAALQVVLSLIGVLAAIMALGWWAREPIEAASVWTVENYGALGIFLMVAVMDPIPGPGHDVALIVGHAGGLGFWSIFLPASLGSFIASILSWAVGTQLQGWAALRVTMERYKIDAMLEKHGAKAVAIAAVGPFPYVVATVGAGASGVPFKSFFLGSLARPVKIAIALGLIMAGWHLTG
jgi:uncharacterized membrane protein YdjX (TVP38/TMEM64 family)